MNEIRYFKRSKTLVDDVNVNRLRFGMIGEESDRSLHKVHPLRGRELQHLFDVEIGVGANPAWLHYDSIMKGGATRRIAADPLHRARDERNERLLITGSNCYFDCDDNSIVEAYALIYGFG